MQPIRRPVRPSPPICPIRPIRPSPSLATLPSVMLLATLAATTVHASSATPDVAPPPVTTPPAFDPRLPPGIAATLPAPLRESDFHPTDPERVALGRLLFHDPLLSGNRNIACATCHHATLASADGVSLGVGEGGRGLGPERVIDPARGSVKHRVPRHSPALFNLGAHEFTTLFHDGRVALAPSAPNGYDTPAEEFLPPDLPNALAAQVLFPLLSEVEMAGGHDSNEIAGATRRRLDHGWREIERRLRATAAYLPHFSGAWPDIERAADIDITHVALALAEFIAVEWRADASPFDRWLGGDAAALSDEEVAGLALFYGEAGCAGCHAGPLQTDHGFHALMLPAFGPGRTRAFDPVDRDPGRMNVTDDPADAYRFRTPSLRNVARTAPYGHNGAYATLEGIVRHHLDPRGALGRWDRAQLVLLDEAALNARDFLVAEDARERARHAAALDIDPLALGDDQVAALLAFLGALTDEASLDGALGPPERVPSGLAVD